MALSIIRNEVDAAGWRRVLIFNDVSGETLPLKFSPGKTATEMRAEAQVIIDAEIARRVAAVAERARIRAIANSVVIYLNGGLNTAQRNALLDALVREWRD